MRVNVNSGKFVGHCELPDFLTLTQCRAFEDAYFGDPDKLNEDGSKKVWLSVNDEKMLPVLISIVKEWHIDNIPETPTPETFPGSPRKHSSQIISQLASAVLKLWNGEDIPNA